VRRRKLILRSIIVAAIVGLIAPLMWFVITGETRRTPVVETRMFEKITRNEIEEWEQANFRPAGFWIHLKSTPRFITVFWREYLVGSAIVFLTVLVANIALLGVRRNEP